LIRLSKKKKAKARGRFSSSLVFSVVLFSKLVYFFSSAVPSSHSRLLQSHVESLQC
jgi:hypothetical protein